MVLHNFVYFLCQRYRGHCGPSWDPPGFTGPCHDHQNSPLLPGRNGAGKDVYKILAMVLWIAKRKEYVHTNTTAQTWLFYPSFELTFKMKSGQDYMLSFYIYLFLWNLPVVTCFENSKKMFSITNPIKFEISSSATILSW